MNKHANYIDGIKLLANDGAVLLEAGLMTTNSSWTHQEIPLAQGERLVGVRSKLYSQHASQSALHCNVVFVIGWLE